MDSLLPALGALFALGFVAWLGKKVVDGNLIPGSITLHMLGALAILGLQPITLRMAGAPAPQVMTRSRRWIWVAGLLTLAQLVFGTQVREAVDHLVHDGVDRADWLAQLPGWWKGHRTAFWAILAVHLAWLWPGLKSGRTTRWEWTVIRLVAGTIRYRARLRPARHARRSPAASPRPRRWPLPHGWVAPGCRAAAVKPNAKATWATM